MSETIPRSEWARALKEFTDRNASRITEIAILTGPEGQDEVLRIGHGEGQTLLRLRPIAR